MLTRLSQIIFVLAILLTTLILAKAIFIPLAFALLIAFLLYPICKYLERKLPRIVAVSLVFIGTTIFFALMMYLLVFALQSVMADMSTFEELFGQFKDKLLELAASVTGISESSLNTTLEENIGAFLGAPMSFLSEQIFNSSSFLFSAMITGIFAFLMLLYRTVFKNFILSQIAAKNRSETKVVLKDMQKVSQKYVVGLFMVMGILGVLNTLGLWAIGVKYPLFWGFFAAVLTIVPYAGTFAGGFFPFIFTILTSGTVWQPVAVVVLFFSIQFLEDNFIKPKVVGQQIDLNPFTAIIVLIVGGIIWGIPGFVLALPYMALMKIFLENFDETEPLAALFSSEVYDKPKVFQNKYAKPKYSLRNLLKVKDKDA